MDVSEISTVLDDHGFTDTSSTRKVAYINDTIWDICSRQPWTFLEKELILTFTGNAYASNWPTDFKSAVLITDPSSGSVVDWERWDTVNRVYANAMTVSGTPQFYYFVAKRAQFYPVPGTGKTLKMLYIRRHPELTISDVEASILIPSDHHESIVLGTLYKLYRMEDDPELSAVFRTEYEERLMKMSEDLARDQYQAADTIFTVDPEDYDAYPYA